MNSLSTKVLRVVATLTAVATILSLSGVAVLAPVASAAIPSDYGLTEGNTISAAGTSDPDVYIVNDQGYKRLFLNPVIFSMYGHLGGFAKVKSVSAAARDAFPTSGLFRVDGSQKVYGIEVTGEDTSILHWVNTSGAQAVADDANFFKKVFVINQTEFNWYTKGTDYASVSQVPNYSRVPGSTPLPNYGALSVGLAYDNPAAGTIVDGQARYELAKFNFSGSGTVTSFKLKRVGVSADASLTNVYLYSGTTRLTDSVNVSSSELLFNDTAGLFTVSGSKTISVVADVDGTSGETIGVQAIAMNGNAVSLSGNLHAIASATLATATFAAVTAPTDGVEDNLDTDQSDTDPADDVVVWQDTVTVGQRYVWMKSVQFRVIGSAAASDVQSFRLFVDGVQQGTAVAQRDVNGYVVFDFTSPVKLETGGRVLKVLANIIGGSSKEFYLSLRQKSDFWAVDSQYNAAVLSSSTFPIGDVDNDVEIAAGTLTITRTNDSASGDVVKDASGVSLAKFEFKAAGERMKVENLRISNTSGTDAKLALRNAALFADGVQIGSTTTLWEDTSPTASNSGTDYAEVSLGSSLIVTPGTPRIIEIRADIFDASGTNNVAADQTIIANLAVGSSNVQRLTTLDYVSYPAAVKVGNQLTVKTGSFTAGKYTGYANQSVVAPKTGVKLGHFTLAAASSEDVNVNTLVFEVDGSVAGSLSSDFTDGYVKVYNDAGTLVLTSVAKTTLTATTAALGAASNSYSVNFTMPKNKTYQVELWANVASTFDTTGTADAATIKFKATGTTTGSSTSVTATQATGQTVTSASGSLTYANGTLPAARLINGGSTITGYQFTLTPTYDDYTLDEVYVDLSATTASSSGAVSTLILKNGATELGRATVNATTASASFTGVNLPLLQSAGTKTLTVDVQLSNVGAGFNDTAGVVTVRLDGMKYRNSSGTVTTENGYVPATYTGNANNVVKGYPTFTAAQATTVLGNSAQSFFKVAVIATGAQVAWNDITFSVASTSGTMNIATSSYQIWENGVNITGDSVGATASDSYSGSTDRIEFSFATERVIPSTNGYTLELRGTASGALSSGNTVTVQIANPKGTTVTTTDSTTQAASGASFVWTDQSAASHTTSTTDWFTDGMVKTLAESQSVRMP